MISEVINMAPQSALFFTKKVMFSILQKKFILIIFALFVGISLFGCVKKPTPAINQNVNANTAAATSTAEIDTSNWKTYKNKIIGIEFMYPQNWPNLNREGIGDTSTISFSTNLIDLSHLDHTYLDYDNLPINIQYSKIKCNNFATNIIECEEKISKNNLRYVWIVEETPGGPSYGVMVATGKYILIFNFQDEKNYNKRKSEYQGLLSTLRIPS